MSLDTTSRTSEPAPEIDAAPPIAPAPPAAPVQQPARRSGRHARWLRVLGVVVAALVVTGVAAIGVEAGWGGPVTPRPVTPRTAELVGMYDSPAVQLVTNRQQATVTWYAAQTNLDKLIRFANTDPTSVSAWQDDDDAAASDDVVQQLLAHPATYLTPGAGTAVPWAMTSWGSAWGVSANGYLVTNHHVTAAIADRSWIDSATAGDPASGQASVADQVAAAITQKLQQIYWNGTTPLSITDAETQQIAQLAQQWVDATSQVSGLSRQISVGGGQNVKVSDDGTPARVVSESAKTWPDADVAILKVDATDLPVVPLGDDTTLQAGDTVHALGYPYEASFDSGTSRSAAVTATLTSGQVTNRLRSPDGFSAIEDSATINHGNSGGPLLDSRGRVVGMVTAVDDSTESTAGVNGGKLFYAVPVSLIEKYLHRADVTPLVSADQRRYDQAMTLMQGHHDRAALTLLRRVEADGYSTPYVMTHAAMVSAQIRAHDDVPVGRRLPWLLVVGAALALSVVAGAVTTSRTRT